MKNLYSIVMVVTSLVHGQADAEFELPPPGPTTPVTVECIQQAAQRYQVAPLLILAILKTEGGRPGLAMRNKNNTYDLGPMQVNTRWVRELGLNPRELRDHGCYNVHVGTAILANELYQAGELGAGIGNYHSRTPKFHQRYRRSVQRSLRHLRSQLLSQR